MSLLGQDESTLIDCTEAVPTAIPNKKATTFPAGTSAKDLQLNVSSIPTIPTILFIKIFFFLIVYISTLPYIVH